ncbi:ribonuclease P protein subunit RPR2 [Microdochium nivale]|nr:ribonuclease P protein subunit RPR2 [Microdochium nivale]
MAKGKGSGNVPNRPIYARMSFLYQAAAYLSNHAGPEGTADSSAEEDATIIINTAGNTIGPDSKMREALSRRYMTDMRSTSKKAQISMSPALKHTICKYCDTLLVEGQNSTTTIENLSKGGRKPWADMLIISCRTCGGFKRFPVHAPRQKRRLYRAVTPSAQETEPIVSNDAALQDQETLLSATSVEVGSV